MTSRTEICLNGVTYRWPDRPVVVVCIDGGDPAYFDRALKEGIVPNVARFMKAGFGAIAQCVIPSFTCPNNVSIVTGSPPSVHGISGNFYLEPETGKAAVMTGPELMRSTTILAEFSRHGAKVAAITAKDKLRQQLGKDMNIAGGCINFSSEKADQCTKHENGIENVLELVGMPLPDMYSPELSLFVLEAGAKLLKTEKPLVMYLSLTDYFQHKYAPGEPEADRYYRDMDKLFVARRGRWSRRGSWHARQVQSRRLAQSRVASGRARSRVRKGCDHRDLPDHRLFRGASRIARQLRARLLPPRRYSRSSDTTRP
jgi:phosphonoacetate hydrolase